MPRPAVLISRGQPGRTPARTASPAVLISRGQPGGVSQRTTRQARHAGPVSLMRMARNSRGVPRSTVSRGSGTVRNRSTASAK